MPASIAGMRFPFSRVLLPRTRLAYVHLRNLLTDAKRDRAARVSGYVAIWLPDELLLLYMQRGEVVNATAFDGKAWRTVSIVTALAHVPGEPEYGEICFHEADDAQLSCMFAAQTTPRRALRQALAPRPLPATVQTPTPPRWRPWPSCPASPTRDSFTSSIAPRHR